MTHIKLLENVLFCRQAGAIIHDYGYDKGFVDLDEPGKVNFASL